MDVEFIRDLYSLEGKTVLLTGGTRGIGAAMAEAVVRAGAHLILAQRNPDDLSTRDALASLGDFSGRITVVACDLRDAAQVATLVSRVTAVTPFHVLVNCGGVQARHAAERFPETDYETVMQVNLHAPWRICRDAGAYWIASSSSTSSSTSSSPSPSRTSAARFKIVNVASLMSYQGGLEVSAYATSKHGILGLTRALSNEWAGHGIDVNCIAPGYVATELTRALREDEARSRGLLARIPTGRYAEPRDFVACLLFLTGRGSDYVSGESIVVDGGWMAR